MDPKGKPWIREAWLQKNIGENLNQCLTCIRRCKIKDGSSGYCGTRVGKNGKIYTMLYGIVSSMAVSPIEKKPMFHFYPGSLWLSIGSFGCNFRCPGCQNWEIAHKSLKILKMGSFIPPDELVKIAENYKCKGISWTYNEPLLSIEYILDCAKICKERGLLTNLVTNGSFTEDSLSSLIPYLDSARIDLKGFSKETYRRIAHLENFEEILNSIKKIKISNIPIELITNVIPEYNDKREEIERASKWILENLGDETPWHLTRFFPHRFLSHIPPTPVRTLELFREIAIGNGLKYVYIGNVPGHPAENTYCPNCKNVVIEREGIYLKGVYIKEGRCPFCGENLESIKI
jgi:pyruvate formate lyase activating enzyme